MWEYGGMHSKLGSLSLSLPSLPPFEYNLSISFMHLPVGPNSFLSSVKLFVLGKTFLGLHIRSAQIYGDAKLLMLLSELHLVLGVRTVYVAV